VHILTITFNPWSMCPGMGLTPLGGGDRPFYKRSSYSTAGFTPLEVCNTPQSCGYGDVTATYTQVRNTLIYILSISTGKN